MHTQKRISANGIMQKKIIEQSNINLDKIWNVE